MSTWHVDDRQLKRDHLPAPGLRSVTTRVVVWILILLIVGSWIFVVVETSARSTALFSWQTWDNATRFFGRFVGIGETSPAFLSVDQWIWALGLAYKTLAMSVLAIGLSTIGMLLTVMLAARPSEDGSYVFGHGRIGWIAAAILRGSYIFSRAIPELIWAMLIIFILAPGILPAAIALALHNYGILGKLCAEVVEDLDPRPARALRVSGAGGTQTLLYAVLPATLPYFLTYILYRWEVIIRATIIVGFVSASGLGREFRLSMSFFQYTEVTLLLMVYFLLVITVDLVSAVFRRVVR